MESVLATPHTILGRLGSTQRITGSLTETAVINGTIVIPTYVDVDLYSGDYDVSPDFTGKTLGTANKTLTDNITVKPIEVQTMSNSSGGLTVYIGGI